MTETLVSWREVLMAWGALLWLIAGVVLLLAAVVEGVRSFLIDVSGEEKPPEEIW